MMDIFRFFSELKFFLIFFWWHEVINVRLILLLSVIVAKNDIYNELIDLRVFGANIAQHNSSGMRLCDSHCTVCTLPRSLQLQYVSYLSKGTWSSWIRCQKHVTLCRSPYLIEVIQGFVQVGMHARRWLVGDFDGVLQDALWNDVAVGRGWWLCADEDPEVLVAALRKLLQLLLQSSQPFRDQVDILVLTEETDLWWQFVVGKE